MNNKAMFGLGVALVVGLTGCVQYEDAQTAGLRGGRFDPCATVRCAAGTHCESRGRRAECVPDEPEYGDDAGTGLTCATVLCLVGTVCEETPSGPRCVPIPAECTSDGDCRLEDNYCGGCHCLALAEGESGPTCTDPVQCFAAPCAVTSGSAACVDGQCVLR